MKAALALSKIKNEDLKTSETLIEEQRNDLMELKRQLLNEVSWMLINIEIIPSNDQKKPAEEGKVQITGETEDVQAECTRGAKHHQRRLQNLRFWLQNEVLREHLKLIFIAFLK